MWVYSRQVLHLRNPYTDFSVDFDKRMVEEKVPVEVPDDDFIGQHLGNQSNKRPLVVVRDEVAIKQAKAFWATIQKEADAKKAEIEVLLNEGSVVGYMKSQELHVPKVLVPEKPKDDESPKDSPESKAKQES